MEKQRLTVIIVTAYGDDNYYQKRYEDIVGIYSSVNKAIKGAKEDGLTNSQMDYLDRTNAFYMLGKAIKEGKSGETFQVDFEDETDKRKKPCKSSYQFTTYNID